MLAEDIKNIRSKKSDLRKFGVTVGIVLGLLGGVLLWRDKDLYLYFLAVSLFLIISGLISPFILKPLQKAWMTIAIVIGWFMTRLILCMLFFFLLTPIRFIARIFGKVFLDRKFRTGAKSYWIPRDTAAAGKDQYEKQF